MGNKTTHILISILILALIFVGFQIRNLKSTLKSENATENTDIIEESSNLSEYKLGDKEDILIPELDYTISELFQGDKDSLEITRSVRGKSITSKELVNYSTKEEVNLADFNSGKKKIIVNASLTCPACLEYLGAMHELVNFIADDTEIFFIVPIDGIGTELEAPLLNIPKTVQDKVYLIEFTDGDEESEFYRHGTPYTQYVNGSGKIEVAFNGWLAPSYWQHVYITSLEKRMPDEGEIDY